MRTSWPTRALEASGGPARARPQKSIAAPAAAARPRDVVTTGGFTRFAKVAETPFNQVLEVRP